MSFSSVFLCSELDSKVTDYWRSVEIKLFGCRKGVMSSDAWIEGGPTSNMTLRQKFRLRPRMHLVPRVVTPLCIRSSVTRCQVFAGRLYGPELRGSQFNVLMALTSVHAIRSRGHRGCALSGARTLCDRRSRCRIKFRGLSSRGKRKNISAFPLHK